MRWAVNLVVCVAAFAATALGIGRLVDGVPGARLDNGSVRAKLRHYAEHVGDYDLVFLGSSRVYRQVIPAVFDRRMSEAGREWRSFNFGAEGMRLPEVAHLAHWLLDQQSTRLKWLVVELEELMVDVPDEIAYSARVVNWHTSSNAGQLMGAVRASGLPLGEQWPLLSVHARHYAQRASNLGTALPLLARQWEEPEASRESVYLGPARDGYRSLESETDGEFLERRQQLLDNPEALARRVVRLRERLKPRQRNSAFEELVSGIAQRAEEAGVDVVFLLTPGPLGYPEAYAAHDAGVFEVLLAYNDPDRFPEYYSPENLFDLGHLNERVSRRFTNRLAADFLRELPTRPPR